MTKLRLDYVHRFRDRHGRLRHYFRRHGRRVPLPGLPGSDEFMAAYQAALTGQRVDIGATRHAPGTVAAVVAAYYQHQSWLQLAQASQAMRRAILERFRADHGDDPIRLLGQRHLARIIGKLRPYAQRNWLKTLRGLMAFAVLDQRLAVDPTADLKLARVAASPGFATWGEDQIEAFRAHHALGTRARLALELLLGTGQRRGDVVRMGRQHVRGGVLSIRQGKTGMLVEIPLLPELQAALDAMPGGQQQMTFLVTDAGAPFTPAGFGGWFRAVCDAAGVPKGYAAHGLRKAAATAHANHGATAHELMAWFGWTSIAEAQRYTRAADRRQLAAGMVEKLSRTPSGKP